MRRVFRIISCDLKRLLGSAYIYLCGIGLGILLMFGVAGQIAVTGSTTRGNFIDQFLNIESNEIILLCFLFCIAGGSFQYCTEEKYGYVSESTLRTGVPGYCIGKLVVSAVGGFLTSLISRMVCCLCIIVVLLSEYEDKSVVWPQTEKLVGFMWGSFSFFLLCGMLSAVGFVVTTIVANYYIGITVPIILYYAILSINQWLPVPKTLSISFVYWRAELLDLGNGYGVWTLYVCLYTLCILIILYFIAANRIRRRLEHA